MKTLLRLSLSILAFYSQASMAVVPERVQAFYAKNQIIEVEIKGQNWEELRNQDPAGGYCVFGYEGSQYDWFPFDEIKINGKAVTNVGIKKKSWCGSNSKSKPGINVKFDKYDKTNEKIAQELFGLSDITLNNSKQDLSYIRQCLTYTLYTAAGIPAPLCNFAHLVVNGIDMGLYVSVQPIKKDFIKNHFGSDLGNLYEMSFGNFTDDKLAWFGYEIDSFKDPEDLSLADVSGVINVLRDPNVTPEAIARHVDLSNALRYWALQILTTDHDGFAANNNNAFLYFPLNGKMQLIPWGMDSVLSRNVPATTQSYLANNLLVERLLRNASSKNALDDTLRHYLNSLWNEERISSQIDETAAQIEPFIAADQKESFLAAIAVLKTNINNRRNEILGFIPARTAAQ